MKRHLKKLALCFIIMILCVCINAQENNLSLSGQEDLDYLRVYDAFFENNIPPPVPDVPGIYIDIDDYIEWSHLINKSAVKDLSDMVNSELRSFLEVLIRNLEEPEADVEHITRILNKLSRLTSFSYIGYNPVLALSGQPSPHLFLYRKHLILADCGSYERIGFALYGKNDGSFHFKELHTFYDGTLLTNKLNKSTKWNALPEVVKCTESYQYTPLEYLIHLDSTYCSEREKIVQKCLSILSTNEIEQIKDYLKSIYSKIDSGDVYWGFEEEDQSYIKELEDDVRIFFDIKEGRIRVHR